MLSRNRSETQILNQEGAAAGRRIWPFHWESLWVDSLIFLGVLLRLYHVTADLGGKHSWRQADVAMIASNFYRNGMNFFYPQTNWAGASPGYVGTEFPLVPYLAASLYHLFGEHLYLARLVSIGFFVLAAVFFYRLVRTRLGPKTALFSLFFFIISPLNIYYSRTIMPESAMMAFSIGGLYYFQRWVSEERRQDYLLAVLLTALALLIKPPAAVIAFPMAYLVWRKYGWGIFRQKTLWLFAVLVVVPALAWYRHAIQLAYSNYPYHMFGENVWLWGDTVGILFDWQIYRRILLQVAAFLLTPLGLLLSLAGILLAIRRQRMRFFYAWLAGLMVFFFLVLRGQYLHEYYQLPFVPVASVFAGWFCRSALGFLRWKRDSRLEKWGKVGLFASLFFVAASGLLFVQTRYYSPSETILAGAGKVVDQKVPAGALIVSADWNDPVLIQASNRKGWHFPAHMIWSNPEEKPELENTELPWTSGLLEELRSDGADFFVAPVEPQEDPFNNGLLRPFFRLFIQPPDYRYLDSYPDFQAYLEKHYPLYWRDEKVVIYDLREKLDG